MGNFIGDDGRDVTMVQPQLNTYADKDMDDIWWLVSGTTDKIVFSGRRFIYYLYGIVASGDYYFNRQNGTIRVSDNYTKAFFVIMPDGETIWMTGDFGNGMLKKPN
jgi:hypothetical protein